MAVKTLIQVRRDTAANWTSANPTLSAGEVGFETNTGKFKIGDGSTAWASLSYFIPATGGVAAVATDAIWDAAGDLALGTGADTAAKLSIGTAGYVLGSNGTTAAWYQGASRKLYAYEVSGSDKTSIDTNVDGTTVANFAGYDVLEVFIVARTDDAAAATTVDITLNNDSSAIYDVTRVRNNNTTVTGATTLAGISWQMVAHGATGSASYAATACLRIPGYAGTTFWKVADMTIATPDATAGNDFLEVRAYGYRSTSAITRIKIAASTSQKLKVGSQLIVYGR